MKIINTGVFYFEKSDAAYKGYIFLELSEFNKVIKSIMNNKEICEYVNGTGPYPYLSKTRTRSLIESSRTDRKGCTEYSLGVSVNDYIIRKLKNESRYHYKPQNYIIRVIK